MTDDKNLTSNAADAGHDIDDIGKLIRFAGQRETVDDTRRSQARARVHTHWRNVTTARARQETRSLRTRFALAASFLIASSIGFFFWQGDPGSGIAQPFSVRQVSGIVQVDGRAATLGDVYLPGVTLQSGPEGRIALELPAGQSIRLDHESEVLLTAGNQLELLQGAVYIDSGPDADDMQIAVETRFGTAIDIGTQYQVRIDDDGMQVGVREGRVELSRPQSDILEIKSGYFFDVAPSGVARGREVAGDDPLWQWVAAVSPTFSMEGATLEDYLTWYARESGLELRWATPQSRLIARRDVLSGSIAGRSVEDSFQFVQQIAPFEARRVGPVLEVAVQ